MTYRRDEWTPGDLAMVTAYNHREPYLAYLDREHVWKQIPSGPSLIHPVTIRPLVLLDPESDDDALRLAQALYTGDCAPGGANQQRARYALRALVTPPKPEEPQGLGAVVEDVVRWVRADLSPEPWRRSDRPGAAWRSWDDFDHTVRVLSEGVQ